MAPRMASVRVTADQARRLGARIPKKARVPRGKSELEEQFKQLFYVRSKGKPWFYPLTPQYRFHAKRQWTFDFAIVERSIAIELEGGHWINGRHNRGTGYENDCEKYNAASEDSWVLLRATKVMIPGVVDQLIRILDRF